MNDLLHQPNNNALFEKLRRLSGFRPHDNVHTWSGERYSQSLRWGIIATVLADVSETIDSRVRDAWKFLSLMGNRRSPIGALLRLHPEVAPEHPLRTVSLWGATRDEVEWLLDLAGDIPAHHAAWLRRLRIGGSYKEIKESNEVQIPRRWSDEKARRRMAQFIGKLIFRDDERANRLWRELRVELVEQRKRVIGCQIGAVTLVYAAAIMMANISPTFNLWIGHLPHSIVLLIGPISLFAIRAAVVALLRTMGQWPYVANWSPTHPVADFVYTYELFAFEPNYFYHQSVRNPWASRIYETMEEIWNLPPDAAQPDVKPQGPRNPERLGSQINLLSQAA